MVSPQLTSYLLDKIQPQLVISGNTWDLIIKVMIMTNVFIHIIGETTIQLSRYPLNDNKHTLPTFSWLQGVYLTLIKLEFKPWIWTT